MSEAASLLRYSIITDKNPREIILLRGRGCRWKKCRFCDYHKDFSLDDEANYVLNQELLQKITGQYRCLEVINSGSFVDLDTKTLLEIRSICQQKKITQVHFECHWAHKDAIADFRAFFKEVGVTVKIKMGVETFDALFRECYLVKALDEKDPKRIADYCDEVCLLQGIPGQSEASMKEDIEIGLTYFERVCINIMVENSTRIKPDPKVITCFMEKIYPHYKNNPRVDILLNNTDFGVGGIKNNE